MKLQMDKKSVSDEFDKQAICLNYVKRTLDGKGCMDPHLDGISLNAFIRFFFSGLKVGQYKIESF